MYRLSILTRRVRLYLLSMLNSYRYHCFYRMKVLLFTLIRAFEFELAVPASDIGKKSFIVQRPLLRSNPKAGNQMPLILKPVVLA